MMEGVSVVGFTTEKTGLVMTGTVCSMNSIYDVILICAIREGIIYFHGNCLDIIHQHHQVSVGWGREVKN